MVCHQGDRHAASLESFEEILHEVAGLDAGQLLVVAEQHHLGQLAALQHVAEQPLDDLDGDHAALVHRHDPHRGELPRRLLVRTLPQFVAGDDLVDGEGF